MIPDWSAVLLHLKLLVLLAVANGAPLLGHTALRHRWNAPLDGGLKLRDGRPLFGPSKTARGIALALVATPLASLALGVGLRAGLLIGAFAMLGDLCSSFIKRRLGLPPSSQALVVDQVPESLFPLLAVRARFELTGIEITWLVLAFVVLELLLSRVLYKLRLRDQPY